VKIDAARPETYPTMEMATKKKAAKTTFRAMVAIRVLEQDAARLDALAERLPFVSRHALARAALKIGLAALEADPRRIVEEEMVSARKRPSAKPRHRG
jgi:hypothetical protein